MVELFPDILIWLALGLTTIQVFWKFNFWRVSLVSALVLALYLDRMTLGGFSIICMALLAANYANRTNRMSRRALHFGVLLTSLALALHLIPGFNNWLVLNQVYSGNNSTAFSMYLNLDKPLVFFCMFLLMPSMLTSKPTPRISIPRASILGLGFLSLFPIAVALNLVHFELTLPSWWWLFLANNLLFTCVVEEAFFRGYLQNALRAIPVSTQYKTPTSIAITSLLFGLAHFPGGLNYVFVATLAGAVYGLSYHWTGRLSVVIAIHFLFNLIHLVFFTYPLASAP